MFTMFINIIIDKINRDLEGIFTVEEIQLCILQYVNDAVNKSSSAVQSM